MTNEEAISQHTRGLTDASRANLEALIPAGVAHRDQVVEQGIISSFIQLSAQEVGSPGWDELKRAETVLAGIGVGMGAVLTMLAEPDGWPSCIARIVSTALAVASGETPGGQFDLERVLPVREMN